LGEFGVRVNAILPGAVDGSRIDGVFEGRAAASGNSVAQERAAALANQSMEIRREPLNFKKPLV
jgi:NAD(P)-dependent dehydrogenase (short-subunit alcohol dehydrogenase family)